MENKNLATDEVELDEFIADVERKWRDTLPHLSDTEWLKVFPEARGVLAEKTREWSEEKKRLMGIAKRALLKSSQGTAEKYVTMRLYIQAVVLPKINATDTHIARLRRQQFHFSPRPSVGRITDVDIQRAKEVPIDSLISSSTRRTGKTLTTNCPLHKDRTPSFVIYRESNTCWCFGCQQGGDSIALIRLLYNLSFIDAVKYLQTV